jgi:hypothetical protein
MEVGYDDIKAKPDMIAELVSKVKFVSDDGYGGFQGLVGFESNWMARSLSFAGRPFVSDQIGPHLVYLR